MPDTYRSGGKIHTMRKKKYPSKSMSGPFTKESSEAFINAAGEAAKKTVQKVRAKKKTDNMKRMKKAKESAQKRKSTPKTYTA